MGPCKGPGRFRKCRDALRSKFGRGARGNVSPSGGAGSTGAGGGFGHRSTRAVPPLCRRAYDCPDELVAAFLVETVEGKRCSPFAKHAGRENLGCQGGETAALDGELEQSRTTPQTRRYRSGRETDRQCNDVIPAFALFVIGVIESSRPVF